MQDLCVQLAHLGEPNPATHAWRPRVFDLSRSADAAALSDLIARGGVTQCFDTLLQQVAGLVKTRCPAERLEPEEVHRRALAHLGATPAHAYGCWVYYPWSGRLVHLLGPEEFAELRTSRNRNKITRAEQKRLASLRVAVAGLSVGQATALTLALEGVGGAFRLADFDRLELSNMNRLRAGVHELGFNKAILTAQRIFEMCPYADVEVLPEGVTRDNIDAFLDGVDLLFEECDDLYIKVRLREEARARRIPVLMETSDRGLIDVERFDLEPERPLLHGLVGDLSADELVGLSTYEKVPIVLRMIGADSLSPRMAASLVDIETTLETWPQLASGVALGGALNTDVARRVALGEMTRSGRYYVDLEQLVCDGVDGSVAPPAPDRPGRALPKSGAAPRPAPRGAGALDAETVRALVHYATLAPSGGNCQPWRFVLRGGALYVLHDRERSASFLDFEDSASLLALGCAVENVVLAAEPFGLRAEVEAFPAIDLPHPVAAIRLRPRPAGPAGILERIVERATNRRLGPPEPVDADTLRELRAIAEAGGARLQIVEDPAALERVADVLGRGDRLRFLSEVMHRELMGELRWSRDEAERTRDGIDVATLELTPTDLAGMRLVSRWPIMEVLRATGAGQGLEKSSRKAVQAASAVGLLTFPGTGPRSYFEGGRVLQRVWLAATGRTPALAVQPMTSLLYLLARAERGGPGFTPAEQAALGALRADLGACFALDPRHAELMLFRLAVAGPPSARSLRRPVDEVLRIEG